MQFSCWKSTMPFVYWTIARSAGHARRRPGSSQCMHWSLRISHCNAPLSPMCSLNLIRFQKFHAVDGIVWYVLSNVVCRNGMSFHSTQATSHALQPMHVVTSTYLQTSSSRWTPAPGTLPEWPEICLICSVPVGITVFPVRLKPDTTYYFPVRLKPDATYNTTYVASAFRRTYTFSSFTKNPLNSGVYALGSITVGDRRLTDVSAVRPASSAMPRYPQ